MNRRPSVAGKFYPGNSDILQDELDTLFERAVPRGFHDVQALIVPHAGYVYSGKVAASAYNQLAGDAHFERIFIIASSHHVSSDKISTYHLGNYKTPLGDTIVDTEFTASLIEKYDFISYLPFADTPEHSIEVQLPFIAHHIRGNYKIVPLIICTWNNKIIEKLAEILAPYFTSKNLFIISTDFSHYPTYNDAVKIDNETADALCSNSISTFLDTIDKHKHQGTRFLDTDLCGWTSVLCLLHITGKLRHIAFHKIDYQNSGDSVYGDKSRVVGYYSIAVVKNEKEFEILDNEKVQLLQIARTSIEQIVTQGTTYRPNSETLPKSLLEHCGAFVSLHKNGNLRGCIGRFGTSAKLCDVVASMAIAAATQDHRFSKVTSDELPLLSIEISVITPLRPIKSIDEIEIGKHGIYITKGARSGTFLPQVATEMNWDKEEFLGHCSRDKAGLGWFGWKDAKLQIYEAIVFHD